MKKLISIYLIAVIFCLFPFHYVEGQEDFELTLISDKGLDLDNNGLFDQLEIIVECNITVPGNYILQTGGLISTNGTLIPVTGSQELFLDAGKHVFTILLDGRQIRGYELDFVNISRIDLINSEYTQAGFINNAPFSNLYKSVEFEGPPEYDLGIMPGDWMRYKVTNIWHSNSTGLEEPLSKLIAVAIEVKDVEKNLVSLEMAFLYESGEVITEELEGYIEPKSQIYPFIIPLGIGDDNSFNAYNISRTETGDILGEEQQINIFESEDLMVQGSNELWLSQRHKWDYSTGLLTDSWFNTTYVEKADNYLSHSNVSLKLYTTNVIPQKTAITLSLNNVTTIDEELDVSAELVNYHMDGIKNQTIVFKLNGEEYDSVATDETGTAETVFLFTKFGDQMIEAVFEGALGYNAIHIQKVIELTNPRNNNAFVIPIIVVIIIMGAAIVYRMKK